MKPECAKFGKDLLNVSKVRDRPKTNWPRFFGLPGTCKTGHHNELTLMTEQQNAALRCIYTNKITLNFQQQLGIDLGFCHIHKI